jgi:Domain of unknown function (DUF3806)
LEGIVLQLTESQRNDMERIVRPIIEAEMLVKETIGCQLNGTPNDLKLIQRVLDSGFIEREAAYPLQTLGMAFGRIITNTHLDYSWCLFEDGADMEPAIQYRGAASLLIFPRTLLSKRVKSHGTVDVIGLYNGLLGRLQGIVTANYAGL